MEIPAIVINEIMEMALLLFFERKYRNPINNYKFFIKLYVLFLLNESKIINFKKKSRSFIDFNLILYIIIFMFKRMEKYIRFKIIPHIIKILVYREKISPAYLKNYYPKKIILIKYHHKIGDLILGTPVFRNLKDKFPSAKIDFLAGHYNYPAVLNNPFLDNIFIFKTITSFSDLIHNLRLLWLLNKSRYNLGIIFSASSFSVSNALLGFFIHPKILMGLQAPTVKTKITKYLYQYEIPLPKNRINESLLYLKTISPLVPKPNFLSEEIYFSKAEEKIGKKFKNKYKNLVLIGIHHGGTYPDRMWPKKNIISLIHQLIKNKKIKIILFSGKGKELKDIQLLKKQLPENVSLLGYNQSFRILNVYQKYLDLFIGNDTGTLHSAVATGISCIGIYIQTDPKIWAGLNKNLIPLYRPSVNKVLQIIKKWIKPA